MNNREIRTDWAKLSCARITVNVYIVASNGKQWGMEWEEGGEERRQKRKRGGRREREREVRKRFTCRAHRIGSKNTGVGSQLIRASSWTTVIEARGNERGEVAQQRTSDAVCRDHRETSWLVGSVTFVGPFGSLRIFVRLCARGYRQATNLSVSRRFDTVEGLYVRASFLPIRQKSTLYTYIRGSNCMISHLIVVSINRSHWLLVD